MSSVSVCDLAGCGCVARGVLVRLNGVCVLVDCARCADALLPGGVVPHALPDALLSAEPALDAVLVTDVCGCDLLPLLFRAASVRRGHSLEALCVPRVYATEPVAFVARRVLRDFVQQTAERAGSEGGADEGDVERVADAIVEVHYDEDVVLVDGAVHATALPSGAAANSGSHTAQTIDKTSKLYEKSLELESYFVKIMLSSMRNSVTKTSLNGEENSYAQKMYEDMLYDELATVMTKNAGFGLADQIYMQLV